MSVLDTDSEVGDCPGNWRHLYCLTRVHTTNRVIACSLIYNRNLACDEGKRLDCYDVMSIAGELGMTIITLGILYFMLSYQITPTDATPMQHGRHAAVRPQVI
jgi:hypothetical protein